MILWKNWLKKALAAWLALSLLLACAWAELTPAGAEAPAEETEPAGEDALGLSKREEELQAASLILAEKQDELAALELLLLQQQSDLAAAQAALETKEGDLAALQYLLGDLLSVRSRIIQSMYQAFSAARLSVSVDETTGNILLENALFFDADSWEVKDAGKAFLAQFLPVYLEVMMLPEYRDYIEAIFIEGHTDASGAYLDDLRLSQSRALAVAEYCLEMPALTDYQKTFLQSMLLITGKSGSDPVFDPGAGGLDPESSRRVEISFRLKDAEMIGEISRILTEMGMGGSD